MRPLLPDCLISSHHVDLAIRPRRNRKSPAIRSLIQENHLLPHQLVAPLFIIEGHQRQEMIASMPGISRISVDLLIKEAIELYQLGIRAIDLFPVIPEEKKDNLGKEAINPHNLLSRAIQALKQAIPEMCIIVDIALDPYTSHGHDGIVNESGHILNDPTLYMLGEMSILAAQAGADIVAPSDMMDGRVRYIRENLDKAGFKEVNILSYAAKYASSFYGPFREALHSAPKFGDKKTYQMDPANSREAILESILDEAEGADMLLIKPALAYLDIISIIRERTLLPLAAYHVSGEYAMIMAAAERGWLDADKAFMESLLSIKRAGADFILTYASKRIARLIKMQ
jgi:porphobilinogen synthase